LRGPPAVAELLDWLWRWRLSALRHLVLSKVPNFNGPRGKEGQCTSTCQILWTVKLH